MSNWGTQTFEDDITTDWITELHDAEDVREFLLSCITFDDDEELDNDESLIVLAACEVIIGLLDEPRKGLPEGVTDWLDDNECDDISDVPTIAISALNKVLADDSVLVTGWKEADDYSDWREGVDELAAIIEQLAEA